MPAVAREQIESFHAKQKQLADILAEAKDGDRFDLSRPKVLEALGAADRNDALEKVKSRNRELDELAGKLEQAEAKAVEDSILERKSAREQPVRGGPSQPDPEALGAETLGQKYITSETYRGFKQRRAELPMIVVDMGLKALFQTGAGFAPESMRSGLIVPKADQGLAEIVDLIPAFPTKQANFIYMEETVRTHGAAEVAEGGDYAESTFEFEEKISPVKKIGDHLPVTDEQLEDESAVASLLDQRLRYGVRRRLAAQSLNGNGVGANLRGILQTASVQTHAKGADSIMSAAFHALTKVRFVGDAEPDAFVFHPNDWAKVVLSQETTGGFLWGHPALVPLTRLWGSRVAVSTGVVQGTALVGDFGNFSRFDEKRGVEVIAGYVGDQFKQGRKTLRADVRVAFSVLRPAAFCMITGV